MEIVRKQVERCDFLGGFFLMQSLAGGTGSGLGKFFLFLSLWAASFLKKIGTYLTEILKDEYPNSFLVNQVVWPYHTGEVIVQNYNSIMTLSHLYQVLVYFLLYSTISKHTLGFRWYYSCWEWYNSFSLHKITEY